MKRNLPKLLIALMLFFIPLVSFGQVITLGTASNFVLFTTVGAVTNSGTGYLTHLTGKVGSNSGSSTGFGNVDGTMHSGDPVTIAAAANLLTAYNQLNTATPTAAPSSSLGGGATMGAGVYAIPSSATLGGTLTLDAQGNPGAVFIFQIGGAFAVGSNAKVNLINGAMACNVYWKTEGLVSVGSGSTLRGTIVAHNAAIALGTNDTLEGRALSINGSVTLNSLTAATPIGCGSATLTGPAAPTFGAVGGYAIFSSNGPVSNGPAVTSVTGDVGTNLGLTTGYIPFFVNGTIHPTPDVSTGLAAPALSVTYGQLSGLPVDIELLYPAIFGNNLVLTPHTYLLNAATSLADTVYLNAQGNNNAVFVIRVNGALSTVSNSVVMLVNGTQAKNVFWQVEGAVSLGSNSIFNGNIVAHNGAIDILSGARLNGRALSTTGAITTNGNIINAPLSPTALITGDSTVCMGASIALSGSDAGGVWSISNPRASITNNGVVTGITAGLDTVSYVVTNGFGTSTATKVITINPTPDAGTISGPSTVCVGSSITLTDPATGGIWTGSNPLVATVINGIVTGITPGVNTITYTVTNICGTASTTKNVTVNPVPDVTMPANQVVCNGAPTTAVTYSGAVAGTTFTWTNSNPSIGLAATGTGNMPSFTASNSTNTPTAGTITVTPSANGCTGTSTSYTITVNPTPTTATVANQVVCNGASTIGVSMTGTVAGTTFTWTNSNLSIGLAGTGTGNIPSFTAVNGTNAPTAGTITVTPSANSCTGASNSFTITVNPTPNVATVTNQIVCNGAPTAAVTYTGTVAGTTFTWTNSNTSIGLASTGTGNIPSFGAVNPTSAPTSGTITVTPLANGCTGTPTSFTVKVNPTPDVTTVANQIVCNGAPTAAVTYTGAVTGTTFTWTNSNTTIGLPATGTGNMPSFTALNAGNVPAIANVTVTPSANGCTGSSKSFTLTVNPTPGVTTIANQTVCNGAPTAAVNYTGAVAGTTFTWTNDNTTIGLSGAGTGNIPSFTALNTSNVPATGTITVTPSANSCTGTAKSFTVTVNPTPNTAPVANQVVCNGLPTTAVDFTGTVAGTAFTWSNGNTTIGLVGAGTGNIPSFTALNSTNAPVFATITVVPSANGCTGLATTFTITVNSTPTAPVISLTTPPTVCNMTYFRNFGAATLPPAGINYTWSTINAAISDTGKTQQYALVNFKKVGTATVILTATVANTGCLNTDSYKVDVTSNVADVPAQVIYFNKSFVCLQNNEEGYTWGYDDAYTLAPTWMTSEKNQDYVNASPDLAVNKYWVMVTHNGCIQKTYYNKPAGATMRMTLNEINVSPNPASQQIKVVINATGTGDVQMDIYNTLGRKMYTAAGVASNTSVDISSYPAGVYMVICYRNNEKVTAKFIKN